MVRNLIQLFEAIEENDWDVITSLRKKDLKSPPPSLDLEDVSCLAEIDEDGTASLPVDLDHRDDGVGNDVWTDEVVRQNSHRNNSAFLDGFGADVPRIAMEVRPADAIVKWATVSVGAVVPLNGCTREMQVGVRV